MLVPHNFDWPDTCVSKLNELFTTPTYTYTCNRNVEHFAVGWKKFWKGTGRSIVRNIINFHVFPN